MTTRNKIELISKVMERIDSNKIKLPFDRFSAIMDLDCSNVNLEELVKCDNYTFIHDVCGIFANMNRKTKTLDNCFVPRVGFNKKV